MWYGSSLAYELSGPVLVISKVFGPLNEDNTKCPLQTSCLTFVNALFTKTSDLECRMHLRCEFINLVCILKFYSLACNARVSKAENCTIFTYNCAYVQGSRTHLSHVVCNLLYRRALTR